MAMQFLEKASAAALALPGTLWREQLNSDIADRWRCDTRSDCLTKAWTRGRWSVLMLKETPSRKCLKCLVTR